jgi:acetylornithine deacetylase/succinyl-diaminopimelate desuccinylase
VSLELNAFHREAVQTRSDGDVREMRSLLVETLRNMGQDPEIDAVGNVLARRGTSDGECPHLVLNTHIDTVPPHIPYKREGDVARGRGACDAKGPLSALIDAFCSASIDNGRLTLAITPDEETSQYGGEHLGETLSADGYIVGEPTGLDVCHAARGGYGGRITIYGESAHASDPSAGMNALEAVGPLLGALKRYDETRGVARHELLGRPTLTPTHIEGGGALNQVPNECTVGFDRRPVPPESSQAFFADLQSYLTHSLPDRYEFEVQPAYPDSPNPDAYQSDPDSDLVQTLADVSGGDIRAFGAATEASYFADDGPTVVFGPGVIADEEGPVAHADREYVSLSEVAAAGNAVRSTIETILS